MPSKIRDYEEPESGQEEVELEDMPTSINPYEVLAISKDASDDEVKKAYRKAALLNHPDKAPEGKKDVATEKFKAIAFANAVLSDPARRKRYDITGRTDEAVAIDDDFNWSDYFHEMYEDAVTEASIEKFKKEYQESDEERNDVLKAYTKGKGNMSVVYQTVMLSHVLEDDERFRAIINAAIEHGEVEAFDKYTKETGKSKITRVKRAQREAEEAEVEAKKVKKNDEAKSSKKGASGGTGDLFALIQQRQKDRATRGTTFLDNLEAKYSQPSKKGKKRAMDEPPEEAFAANKKRGKAGK